MKAYLFFTSALCAFMLTGCEDPKFGEDIKDFVDKQAYGVSVAATTGQLKSGWNTTMQQGFQTAIARNEYLIAEAAKISLPKVSADMSLDAAIAALEQADQGVVASINMEKDATETIRRLDALNKSCESREVFDNLGLGSIAERLIGGLARPKRNDDPSANFDLNPFAMLGQAGGDLISRSRYNTQAGLANDAIDSIPVKVMQADAAFEISKKECKKALDLYWNDIRITRRASENLAEALRLKSAAFLMLRRVAEKKVSAAKLEEASKSSGYAKLLGEMQANNFRGNLEIGIAVASEELRSLRNEINQTHSCHQRLKAMEEYQDALTENRAFLKQLDGPIATEDLGESIREMRKKADAADAEFKTKFKNLRNEACR